MSVSWIWKLIERSWIFVLTNWLKNFPVEDFLKWVRKLLPCRNVQIVEVFMAETSALLQQNCMMMETFSSFCFQNAPSIKYLYFKRKIFLLIVRTIPLSWRDTLNVFIFQKYWHSSGRPFLSQKRSGDVEQLLFFPWKKNVSFTWDNQRTPVA